MTDRKHQWTHAQISLTIVVIALAAAALVFRLLIWGRLEHTALVFVGIPLVLALVVILSPTPQSATGMLLKVVTLAMLLAAVVFGEAFVCILFAAPLIYGVALALGLFFDREPPERPLQRSRTLFVMLVVLAPASLEGVLPGFEFERDEHVTVTRVVPAPASAVTTVLTQTPRFAKGLPLFLRLGFPTPAETSGSGLRPGDRRYVQFRHGHHPGVLVLRVVTSAPGAVDFVAESDDSYITHWLAWQRAEVRWREIAPGQTEVSWTLAYRRRLDPAWYFTPLERYGVRHAAAYLIDTLATPE
jgi:hypothetical protein